MNLHTNKTLFQEAIVATAQYKNLREIYVEKDYWVTLALYTIFKDDIGLSTVFKGGTALSKCFHIIERFSEDIDLAILRNIGESDNSMSNKLKKLGKCIESVLPEVEIVGITQKRGMNRKTAHRYEKLFEGASEQVRRDIILEATWLGSFEPYTTAVIQTYIAEMIERLPQKNLIQQYGLESFTVRVLTQERTLCEKIMSLVKFSFRPDPIFELQQKVRHIYDIHKLLTEKSVRLFFESPQFDTLLLKVANDDFKSYRNDNAWLTQHPTEAILFAEPLPTWKRIRKTYFSDFKGLVYGMLPDEKDILNDLFAIAQRLKNLEWKVG